MYRVARPAEWRTDSYSIYNTPQDACTSLGLSLFIRTSARMFVRGYQCVFVYCSLRTRSLDCPTVVGYNGNRYHMHISPKPSKMSIQITVTAAGLTLCPSVRRRAHRKPFVLHDVQSSPWAVISIVLPRPNWLSPPPQTSS